MQAVTLNWNAGLIVWCSYFWWCGETAYSIIWVMSLIVWYPYILELWNWKWKWPSPKGLPIRPLTTIHVQRL